MIYNRAPKGVRLISFIRLLSISLLTERKPCKLPRVFAPLGAKCL